MKILFVTPYPNNEAPSQRFRFEQYLDDLRNRNDTVVQKSFLTHKSWRILYLPGNYIKKGWGVLSGFLKRFFLLFTLSKYDFIFIHREATPIGPSWWEWCASKVFRKKIIYDFDDAIWLPNKSQQNNIAARLKWHSKIGKICKWSYKISCGNRYLADFAKQYNPNVIVNPTTLDLDYQRHQTKEHINKSVLTIGWTGSHSTMKYLEAVIHPLRKLSQSIDFRFLIISNQKPIYTDTFIEFKKWSSQSEIDDLLHIDIGLMPLKNDQWTKGKCGFKALQFLSLGIPIVASPVGINESIVKLSKGGYLAGDEKEWIDGLTVLANTVQKRIEMGKSGFDFIKKNYSVESNRNNFLGLFN